MIVKVIEEIENNLKHLLLCDVCFCINDKTIKRGKLINIRIKDFFIVFQLQIQKGGLKLYEIPYPYDIKIQKNNNVVFNYKLKTLVMGDVLKYVKIKNFKSKKISKFYNTELLIKKHE